MHISFVILHYLGIEDTIECISSIQENVKYKNYSIVVVDNGSNNSTGEQLQNIYKNNSNIIIIINKENLGFAKGNNIGFRYSKQILKADFIIMINNDTFIKQEVFLDTLIEKYNEDAFDIAGPNVISSIDGISQNPINRQFKSIKDVNHRIRKHKVLLFLSYMRLDNFFQRIFLFYKKEIKRKSYDNVDRDFQLHGCCMIFSPTYIKRYDGIYDKTFMYSEEDILRYIVERDDLIMKYIEDIVIYHKEYSSTYIALGNGYKKRQFYYINSIKSCELLKELMFNGD